MKKDAAELLQEALKLPREARAALAGSLIDSLDDSGDEDVESAWEIEVSRRLKELREGGVKLIPWAEARRQIIGR